MPFPATLADAIKGMRGTQGQSRGPFGGRVSAKGQGGFTTVAKPQPAKPPGPPKQMGGIGPMPVLGDGPTASYGPTQVRPQNMGYRPRARMEAMLAMLRRR